MGRVCLRCACFSLPPPPLHAIPSTAAATRLAPGGCCLAAGGIESCLHWLSSFAQKLVTQESCRNAGALVRADSAAAAALARLATLRLLCLTAKLIEVPGLLRMTAVSVGLDVLACLLPDMLARCEAAGRPQLPAECLDGVAVCMASFMGLLDSEVGWGCLARLNFHIK